MSELQPPDAREVVSAIIVTYNPGDRLRKLLSVLKGEVDRIFVVDNGSNIKNLPPAMNGDMPDPQRLSLIMNEQNLGVATALNQGFTRAIDEGYQYALAFDQDSVPLSGLIGDLYHQMIKRSKTGRIGIAAPTLVDAQFGVVSRNLIPRGRFFYRLVPCTSDCLPSVMSVITSGALYDLSVYKEVGPFRDQFFIDYVDTEYCLRLWRAGIQIVVVCSAEIEHRIGTREKKRFLGRSIYPTFHPPSRWYYMSRNRISMIREFGTSTPQWLMYELRTIIIGLVKLLLYEDARRIKIWAAATGTLDGLRGKNGPIPEKFDRKFNP